MNRESRKAIVEAVIEHHRQGNLLLPDDLFFDLNRATSAARVLDDLEYQKQLESMLVTLVDGCRIWFGASSAYSFKPQQGPPLALSVDDFHLLKRLYEEASDV